MHKRLFFIYTLFLVVLISCTRTSINDNLYIGERLSINLKLNSRADIGDEQIDKVRIIVFNGNGELVSNATPTFGAVAGGVEIKIEVARGVNNFYVICNETVELADKLVNVATESDIEAITFSAAGTKIPIPMYGNVVGAVVSAKRDGTNLQVDVNGTVTNDLTVKVDRLVAKIDLTIIKNLTDPNVDFIVEQVAVKVCRMPKLTPLKPNQPYTNDTWAEDIEIKGVGPIDVNGTFDSNYIISPENADKIEISNIYIPEHLLLDPANADHATYLLIDSKYKMKTGDPQSLHTIYMVNLGENPPVNHNLTRNNHYKIYATIKGLGAMGIYAEIVPFKEYYHPVEWKPLEGYAIVSEKISEYGKDISIWNDYSQFNGVLKAVKDKIMSPAQFRYGSIIALKEGSVEADFAPSTDVLWSSTSAAPTAWSEVNYQASGDIEHTIESLAQGKGDPCRLVGLTLEEIRAGKIDNLLWRMPNASEMEWINTARNDVADSRGFYSFLSLITPKSGYRDGAGHMFPSQNKGYYWSSEGAKSFIFDTTNNSKESSDVDDPSKAYSVRCIRTTIHPSRFAMQGSNITWIGGKDVSLGIYDTYLVPFWKLVPETPIPASIQYTVTQGGENDQEAVFTLAQLSDPYTRSVFKSKAFGYGLDGKVHEINVDINQQNLIHVITYDLVSPTDLPIINGNVHIPAEGVTLRYKMNISPELFSPYLDVKDQLKWNIHAFWYNDKSNDKDGNSVSLSDISEVVIPQNDWSGPVAVDVWFNWAESPVTGAYSPFPRYILSPSKVTFIQNNKVK